MTAAASRSSSASQRGFALLLIFFMAAAVALMLYTQLPRVAFESERDREQLLIDRGEQYKRAILLYYNDYKRYPAKIEDLENTNNHRYLRRKYVDPYTGKDEWRLVHTNGMFLTDSLVQKPPANPANSPNGTSQGQTALASAAGPAGSGASPGGFGTTFPASPGGFGSSAAPPAPTNPNDLNNPPQVNAAVLARPSDRPLVSSGAFLNSSPTTPNSSVNAPANTGYIDPASYPPITLFPNGYNAPATATQPGQNQAPPAIGQPGNFPLGVQPGMGQPAGPFQTGALPGQFQSATLPGQFQPGQLQPGNLATNNPNAPFQSPAGLNTQPSNFQNPLGTQTLPPGLPLPGLPGSVIPGGSVPAAPNSFQSYIPPDPNNSANNGFNGFNNGVNNPANPATPINPVNPISSTQSAPASIANSQGGGNAPPTSQAVNLISNLLTTPRQPPSTFAPNNNANQTAGAGIAGVASTFTGPTIKSYQDHTKYEEWEFIFQPQQQQAAPAQANPLGVQTGIGNNSNSGNNSTSFGTGTSPFGNQPGAPAAPQSGLPGLPSLPAQPPSQPNGFPQQ
ncbi:MAG TPA: hypothetical protein VKV74_06390 [Bryobacteraceae bacterium]|nr:hypothetical protein [Bryobacteraceae bacterium]